MKFSEDSYGFIDFAPPIPDKYRHKLREHRLQAQMMMKRGSMRQESRGWGQYIYKFKRVWRSLLSEFSIINLFRKWHRA
jgi:hypothetical protein